MDRISELPPEILHEILSCLSTKTAAQTNVLSKPWFKACSTNSNLNFDEGDTIKKHDEFLRFVDNTLVRYSHENLPISAFKLCISLPNETTRDAMDKWVDVIAKKRVSQFALLVKASYNRPNHRLSDSIFSVESLQQLELKQCNIVNQGARFEDKIKCRNLKSLTMLSVYVSESALDSLISCCPQIMMITLHYCYGFSCIRVSKLPNLLSVSIISCQAEQLHIVDAPKLLSFEFSDPFESTLLNIDTCQNLRRVEFVRGTIDDTFLGKIIPKLPFIKELILHHCNNLKNIKISSSTLEFLSIVSCGKLMQAILDVPELLSLVLSGDFLKPPLSFESVSSQCKISLGYHSLLDDQQFIDLRRFLVESTQSIDLTFSKDYFRIWCDYDVGESGIIGSIDHHPTPEVENLILSELSTSLSIFSYSRFFDAIFWTCSPKRLTVHQCDENFRKFLHRLLQKRPWRKIKSTWKDFLINSQIDYMKRIEDSWVTVDWKMLRANRHIIKEMDTIRFTQLRQKRKIKNHISSNGLCRCILGGELNDWND